MGNHKTNNLANWNILVARGKKIKRDLVSSDERKLITPNFKNKNT